jgi:hypothetical protein
LIYLYQSILNLFDCIVLNEVSYFIYFQSKRIITLLYSLQAFY